MNKLHNKMKTILNKKLKKHKNSLKNYKKWKNKKILKKLLISWWKMINIKKKVIILVQPKF